MSFLAPLYLLGALAVSLPILFHLIRRTPRGRQDFSSVMFLEPSPPRITRRSRIEHWLLLLLRGLAICLLALAFARPFFRQQAAVEAEAGEGRFIAVLLDSSASMRREGFREQALEHLHDVLDSAGPADRVAVYTFADTVENRFSQDAWSALDPAQRATAATNAVRDIEPGWRQTNLGRALVVAADDLEDAAGRLAEQAKREIVVVSDLQAGSNLDALQAYSWPETVSVRLLPVGKDQPPTNAGILPITDSEGSESVIRVRCTNASDSTRESFSIGWIDEFQAAASELAPASSVKVYVSPGQSRVVRAPDTPADYAPSQLVLTGDDHDFDNLAFVAQRPVQQITIVYLGADDVDDQLGQRFYVEPLFPSTSQRNVRVVDWAFEATALPETETGIQMVILAEPPRADQVQPLRDYARAGGLIVMTILSVDDAYALYDVCGVAPTSAVEAKVDDYSMLTDIDFDHRIFAPFSDPRFSDFTALRFWRHRQIDMDALPDARILARFDDGDPAIGEVPLGRGRVVFFAAGWNRDDSQLAVWTKFVPLMNGLLDYGAGRKQQRAQFLVGDAISLNSLIGPGHELKSVRLPGGQSVSLESGATAFRGADLPGIYVFTTADEQPPQEVRVAVNLAPTESRTGPLDLGLLETAGIPLAQAADSAVTRDAAERQRQLQNMELEKQQKLWRWLIIAALAVLLLETFLAGRLSSQRPAEPA